MAYKQICVEGLAAPESSGGTASGYTPYRDGTNAPVRKVRRFSSGATRTDDPNRLDVWGFVSPEVAHRFSVYMHKHREQADGSMRDSDNWQKGMPKVEYAKSLVRHVYDFWLMSRGKKPCFDPHITDMEDMACAIFFNIQGWLLESVLKREITEVTDGRS